MHIRLESFTCLLIYPHIVYQRSIATRLCNMRVGIGVVNYEIVQRKQPGLFQGTALLLLAQSNWVKRRKPVRIAGALEWKDELT